MPKITACAGKEHTKSLNKIWKKVKFESIGPFNMSEQGNNFVFCVSDPISGWVEFLPAKEQTAQAIADFLVEVFSRYGVCSCELPGWTQPLRESIIQEMTAKWRGLLNETEHYWARFWADVLHNALRDDQDVASDIATKICDIISSQADGTWEYKLQGLRLSIRLRATAFFSMFGREFVPSPPKATFKSSAEIRSRGRPRRTEISKGQSVQTEEFEQPTAEIAASASAHRYSLRTKLKPKGLASIVHTLMSKATENRQQSLPKDTANERIALKSMEDIKKEILDLPESEAHSRSSESPLTPPTSLVEPDEPINQTTDDESWSDSDSMRPKVKRKRKRQRLRKPEKSKLLPFKCPKCVGTYVASDKELEVHLSCHKEGSKEFHCPYCTNIAKSWAHIQRHLLSHPEVSGLMSINTPNKRTCPECSKLFNTRDGMLRHYQVLHRGHTRFTCKTCGSKFKEQKTYQRHLDLHANIIHKCMHCQYQTKIRKNIRAHQRIHDGQGFQCEICQKIFTKPSILKGHMGIHSQNRATVTCDLCGDQLLGKASLTQHIKNMHMESETIQCSLCSYVAKRRENLQRHVMRAHTHRYSCTQCVYSTQSEIALQKHIDVCHNEDERPHPCSGCPYRAKDRKSLQDHVRLSHNPDLQQFPCPYCSKFFKTLTMMRHHLPVHTGQHLYSCKICPYTAKYRQTIHHHVRRKHPGRNSGDIIKCLTADEIVTLPGKEHNYFQIVEDTETRIATNSLQDGVLIASNENEIILNADLLATQPSGSFTLPNNIEVQIIEQVVDMEQNVISVLRSEGNKEFKIYAT